MNTHADKISENKSQALTANLSKQERGNRPAFEDNRPASIAQRKLQEAITNSHRAQQLKTGKEMTVNRPQGEKHLADQERINHDISQAGQQKSMVKEETRQDKFEPVQKKENNTGLPDNLKAGIENISGYSMADVKVHYDSDKPAQLHAHAYAQGTDIHIASGQEKHLPHEAWHVVQQKQGRVKPTMRIKNGENINDDMGLEKEADQMGEKAFEFNNKKNSIVSISQEVSSRVIQGIWKTIKGTDQRLNLINNGDGTYTDSKTQKKYKDVVGKPDEVEEIGGGSEDDWSSEEGSSSQAIAADAETRANAGPSGAAKQAERQKQMDRLRHTHGRAAAEHAVQVAVGPKTASQSTFAFGYGEGGLMVPYGTASSAPLDRFSTQRGGLPLSNTRADYGDASHVHAEAGLLRKSILERHQIKHVSVNKDFCPVCAAVLKAFGIGYNEDYVRENFPDTWTNPFNKESESENWKRAADAAKAICAGQKTKLINCD